MSDSIHITILQSKIHLLDLVQDLDLWFNQLQNSYNCELTSFNDLTYSVRTFIK